MNDAGPDGLDAGPTHLRAVAVTVQGPGFGENLSPVVHSHTFT